jgi:nitrate/nitrite transporter NarK
MIIFAGIVGEVVAGAVARVIGGALGVRIEEARHVVIVYCRGQLADGVSIEEARQVVVVYCPVLHMIELQGWAQHAVQSLQQP